MSSESLSEMKMKLTTPEQAVIKMNGQEAMIAKLGRAPKPVWQNKTPRPP